MQKKVFCPMCNDEVDVRIVDTCRVYKVRGEDVEIEDKDTFCNICGEQLFNFDEDTEILEVVNRIYRERHNLLSPDAIKGIRESYGLTQREFSKVLGFGDVTISRYENGAIPDTANNNLIKLCENPKNILNLAKDRCDEDFSFFGRIKEVLSNFIESIPSIYDIANYILLYMHNKREPITNKKLQKLCYYFWCYAIKHTNKYLIIEFEAWKAGPVNPVLYQKYRSFKAKEILSTEEEIEEMMLSVSKFDDEDIEIFDKVISKFGNLSANELSIRTHKERPWKEANRGRGFSQEIISYNIVREFYKDDI